MTAVSARPGAGLSSTRRALAAAAVFGIGWAIIENGLGASLTSPFSPLQVVWWRYGAHLALMAALWGVGDWRELVRTRRPVFQLVRSAMMVIMPGSFVLALRFGVSIDFMWSMFWLSPLLIMAVLWAMGEKPALPFLILAAAGAAAVMFIHADLAPRSVAAIACAAGMTLSFVAYVVMTRMLREETIAANLFYTALGPFVVLTFAVPKVWVTPGAFDALILSCIGLVGFIALYGLDRACHSVLAWKGALGLLTQPLFALGIGAGLQLQAPGARASIGAVLLCVVLAAAWALAGRQSSPQPEASS